MKNKFIQENMILSMFILAIIMSIVAKAYHAFVFLPNYYGSYEESWKIIFSFEHAKAYFKDPIGVTLFIITLLLYAGSLFVVWRQCRK